MADITRQCGHCGLLLTISEYADMATLRCTNCGHGLGETPVTAQTQDSPKAAGLRMKARTSPPDKAEIVPEAEVLPLVKPDRVTLWLGPERWKALRPLAHWLVFVVLLMLLGMVVRLRFTELVRWALYG